MECRLFDRMGRWPGPLWLLAAYGAVRLLKWLGDWADTLRSCGRQGMWAFDWSAFGLRVGGLAAAAIPAVLVWMMLRRHPAAVWLAQGYAGLKALLALVAVIVPLVSPEARAALYPSSLLLGLAQCAAWFAGACWLGRPEVAAEYARASDRRSWWWMIVPVVLLPLFFG